MGWMTRFKSSAAIIQVILMFFILFRVNITLSSILWYELQTCLIRNTRNVWKICKNVEKFLFSVVKIEKQTQEGKD